MNIYSITLIFLLAFTPPSTRADAQAAEAAARESARPAETSAKIEASATSDSLSQEELEDRFRKTLSGSVFNGRWCLLDNGKLSEEREEKYQIQSVTKVGVDTWLIYARIQYGNKDVLVPVPVQVKWAGDTPVISVTKLGIPGLGTYTARVVVYDNTYAGTWSGGGHGGLLHGIINKAQ